MSFLKDCTQCKFYQRGFCSYWSRNVLSNGEAQLCPAYSVIGFVQIGPLDSLAGQLVEYQIPSGIITTLKLADLAVTSEKLANDAVTLIKIANGVITDAKIDSAAAIAESKLNLAYGTSALNAAILLRELLSNKDIANGYLGLDAGAKVPLSKLNPLTNTEIAAGAGILESKLALTYGTQALHNDIATRALQATYAAHDHSAADPTQVDHANLTNVLSSQHHVRYVDSEAKAACVSDVAFATSWDTVVDVAPSKNAVYDNINRRTSYPNITLFGVRNGATINSVNGACLNLPASDADAAFDFSMLVPDTWLGGLQAYLYVFYSMNLSVEIYSGLWYIAATAVGEVPTWNILSGSASYDFAAVSSVNKTAIRQVNLGTTVQPLDRLSGTFQSDASNVTALRIMAMYLGW